MAVMVRPLLADDFADVVGSDTKFDDHRVLALDGPDLDFLGFLNDGLGDLFDKFLHRFPLNEGIGR